MDEPITLPTGKPLETPLSESLARINKKLEALPPGKRGALVLTVGKTAWGAPAIGFGTAARLGAHVQAGAEFEAKLKQRPAVEGYIAFTW